MNAIGDGHRFVAFVQRMPGICHIVFERPLYPPHSYRQIVLFPSQQEPGAGGRLLGTGSMTGKHVLGHVIGGCSRMPGRGIRP